MTRPQNITVTTLLAGNSNVLQPGHYYQKFKLHQQQEALAAHFDFTSSSAWPFLDSWPQLFLHQGCFGWDDSLPLTDNSLSVVPLSSIHSSLINSTETVLPSSVAPPTLADSPSSNDSSPSNNTPSINPQSSINSPSSDRGNLPKSLPDFITDSYKQCDQNILGKAKHLFNSLRL